MTGSDPTDLLLCVTISHKADVYSMYNRIA
eukprot:COSAG06_NODE_36595_length_445_cov_0.757225_1_plen_29_part_10